MSNSIRCIRIKLRLYNTFFYYTMYFKHRFFGRQVSPPNEIAETSIAEKPSGQIISLTKKIKNWI